jgi:hypothetical protein
MKNIIISRSISGMNRRAIVRPPSHAVRAAWAWISGQIWKAHGVTGQTNARRFSC